MNRKKSSIAVIMSVYAKERPEFLSESLDSLSKQSFKCDVFLYCDGHLTNELNMVIDRFSKIINLFIYKSDINEGLTHALNFLISEVRCFNYCYIARMDSDDICYFDRMEKQVIFFQDNEDVDIVGGFCNEFGGDFNLEEKKLPTKHSDLLKFSIRRSPFIHPTVMFRASVFDSGIRYPNAVLTEDLALWYELLLNGFIIANINTCLIKYRVNNSTLSRRNGLSKAICEVKLRLRFMVKSNQVSFSNAIYIFLRFAFHLLPVKALRIAYKFLR